MLALAAERAISLESGSRFGIALSISPRGIDLKLRISDTIRGCSYRSHRRQRDSGDRVDGGHVPAALLAAAASPSSSRASTGGRRGAEAGKEEVAARTAADARRLAAAEARLISREAAQRRSSARAAAPRTRSYYGDVAAARGGGGGGGDDESDEGGSGGRWLDVRIALQHAVVDGAPAARRVEGRPPRLAPVEGDAPRIAYELAGVACEAEAADAEAVSIGAVQ